MPRARHTRAHQSPSGLQALSFESKRGRKRVAVAIPVEQPSPKRQQTDESSTTQDENERYSAELDTTPEPEVDSELPKSSYTPATPQTQTGDPELIFSREASEERNLNASHDSEGEEEDAAESNHTTPVNRVGRAGARHAEEANPSRESSEMRSSRDDSQKSLRMATISSYPRAGSPLAAYLHTYAPSLSPNSLSPASSPTASPVPSPQRHSRSLVPWSFIDNVIITPQDCYELTNSGFADAMHAVANFGRDNPDAAAPSSGEIKTFLQDFAEHQKQQNEPILIESEHSAASGHGETSEENDRNDENDTHTPKNTKKKEPLTELTTPSSQKSWATYFDPRNLIRTPLKFLSRRGPDVPATEVRRSQQSTKLTPIRRNKSASQAPATIAHPTRRPLEVQSENHSKPNEPIRMRTARFTKARLDSHLPTQLRGCMYKDLPSYWQERSQDMLAAEQAAAQALPPTPRNPLARSARKVNTEPSKKTQPSLSKSFLQTEATRSGVSKTTNALDLARQRAAMDVHYQNRPKPTEVTISASGTGAKRKRTCKKTVTIQKVYVARTERGGFGLPEAIFKEESSDEEVEIEVSMFSGDEADGEDECELLVPDSPSNPRILRRVQQNGRAPERNVSNNTGPSKTFTCDNLSDSSSDSEDSEVAEERPSKRVRFERLSDGRSSASPASMNQTSQHTTTNAINEDFSMISDEDEWDIDEDSPELYEAWSLKTTKPWLAMIVDIRQNAIDDKDAAQRIAAFKKWWKMRMRYQKKYNTIAKREIDTMGWHLFLIPPGPWGAVTLKSQYYDREKWPTPVPPTWDELHPFSLHPPRPTPSSSAHKSVVFEQSQRQLTPAEFGDPTKARPYNGTMIITTPNEKLALERRQREYEGVYENPAEVEALSKARSEALRHRPKVPSNLNHSKLMSPLQHISGNILKSDAAKALACVTTDPEVLEAVLKIPEPDFAFDFRPHPPETENDVERVLAALF